MSVCVCVFAFAYWWVCSRGISSIYIYGRVFVFVSMYFSVLPQYSEK